MKGRIRDYSPEHRRGIITGSDGAPYSFSLSDWREADAPVVGVDVDFVVVDGGATSVYRAVASSDGGAGGAFGFGYSGAGGDGRGGRSRGAGGSRAAGEVKSRGTAAALALFLGWMGAHKFYLGYTAQGMIMLTCGVVSLLLWSIPLANFGEITIDVVEYIGDEFRWQYRGFDEETRFLVVSPPVISTMIWTIAISALVSFIVVAVALIEFVTYISMSDEDFDDVYVTGRRVWF